MIEQDDEEDFCGEIVEEIVHSALDVIYEAYLQRQLIPHTVDTAKDALLQIIEVRFQKICFLITYLALFLI